MSTVVAIGNSHGLQGFVLAGVPVITAVTEVEVGAAWTGLDDEVGLVILSPAAARAVRALLPDRPDVLTVVMP